MRADITKYLIEKLNPSFIILFGSFANGTHREESDLDLAFYPKEGFDPPTPYKIFMISQDLAHKFKREVDLVNLKTVSTVFKAQIYATGDLLFSENKNLFAHQQMTALSMYAKLNEERKNILDKINERGSIYEK